MSRRERSSLAASLFAIGLLLGGQARAESQIDQRVAIFKALVRNEELPPQLTSASPTREMVERESLRLEPAIRCRSRLGSNRTAEKLSRAVIDASLRYAVPGDLIRSVIRHESAYDPEAISPVGAMGLMQLMPATARALGVTCPYDPRENIMGGTRYLRRLRDRFASWHQALAAYNAGPTAVLEDRIPGITRLYVRRVMASWRRGVRDGA